MKLSKFLSVLLTVCMIVSLVPAVAIPARANRSDPVAKIGDTEYYTIKEAVKAAKDGDTVTLLAGVKLDYNKNEDPEDATLIIKDKDITLDLNDYFVHINYSCVGYRVIKVLGTGKLTLTDNAKSGTIRYIVLGNDGSSHPGRGWTVQTEQPSGEDGTDYLKVEGGFITGGNANGIGGGAVFVEANATFTMSGGTILGNTTCTDSNGNAVYHGGGVYSLGTFNMTGGTIRNNVAWGNGGGVYAAGEFNMSGGEIKGNTATVFGGGVCVSSTGAFKMSDGIIGGTVYSASNHALYGGGVLIEGNGTSCGTFEMTGGAIGGNIANTFGGGVYSIGEFSMSGNDTKIDCNTAIQGGGVYVHAFSNCSFSMSGGEIRGNRAVDANATGSPAMGGGVYIAGDGTNAASFEMTGGTILDNSAVSHGGGVYSAGTFTMSDGSVVSNSASVNGGGVDVGPAAEFTLSGGDISGNTAVGFGGGVCVDDAGRFIMDGGTIGGTEKESKNTALYGGGVFVSGNRADAIGEFTMTGGRISGNNANHGGGVYIIGEAEMNGASAEISGNTANGNGGGVGIHEFAFSSFSLVNGKISENSASLNGGGVWTGNTSTFAMANGTISGNTAAVWGGGVSASGKFTMSGGTICSNTSTAIGGGIFAQDEFTMSGGTICKNTVIADKDNNSLGGGVYAMSAFKLDGKNAVISENLSALGGGVFIQSGANLNMSAGTIKNNAVSSLGGVFVMDGGTISLSGSVSIKNNLFNGIWDEEQGTYVAGEGSVTSNVFMQGGGAITLTGALDNTACVGVAMAAPGTFTCDADKFGITASNISSFFTSDLSSLAVGLDESGEAALAAAVSVAFNANDGTETPATSTQSFPGGLTSALTKNDFTRTGYDFAGWATTADGAVVYADSESVKLAEGITLYAKWNKLPTNVSIDSVSTDGKTLGYTVTNAEKGALLIAASYDSRGTLLSVAVVDLKDAENVTDSVSLAVGGTTYKLMLVNASYVPLCKAAVWPLLG